MKVLLTGSIGYNLMAPFYRNLKESLPDSYIAVNGLRRPGIDGLKGCDVSFFDKIISVPEPPDATVKRVIFKLKFFKLIDKRSLRTLFKLCITLRIKKAYVKLYHLVLDALVDAEYRKKFSEFSVVNIHYLSPGNLAHLNYVDDSQKVILSFWGSDLFQLTGLELYKTQLSAIQRADFITMHSPEMKQIFLSKFGRKYESKIRLMFFGCDEKRLNSIEQLKVDLTFQTAFKSKHKIPNDKMLIQVGYSGNKGQNHIGILKGLESKLDQLTNEICFIIPTTYGNSDLDYFEDLKLAIDKSSFDCVHIVDYMTDKEALLLAVICDIHINLRDADAFNASMLEAVYAGSYVIVGDWLPYGMLRRKGGIYKEVGTFDELSTIVLDTIENKLLDSVSRMQNKNVILNFFSMSENIEAWKSLYEECR